MGKGILLEMAGRQAVVLTPQGEFKKVPVPRGAWEIGDEIEYAEARGSSLLARWTTAAAAAAVLFMGSFVGYNQYTLAQPVAVVTVDINPSLELTLNKVDQVLKAEPKNADGQLVLQGVDYKRKPLADVLAAVTERAVEEHKLNPADDSSAVLVGVAPAKAQELPKPQIDRVVEKAKAAVMAEVKKAAQAQGQTPRTSVAVLSATSEEKQEAEKEGLSVGKFKLLPEVQAVAPQVTPEQMQSSGPGKLLHELHINPSEVFSKAEKKNEEPKGHQPDAKVKPVTGTPGDQSGTGKKDDQPGKGEDKKEQPKQPDDKKNGGGAQQNTSPGAPQDTKPENDKKVESDSKKPEAGTGSLNGTGKQGEPKKDEPKKEQPKQSEPKKEGPKQSEPKKDEPKKDDGKKDSWTIPWLGITIQKPAFLRDKDEPQQAEAAPAPVAVTPRAEEPGVTAPPPPEPAAPKKEEPKQAEPKQAEPKQAEPKQAEPKQAEPKKAEPKTDESAKPEKDKSKEQTQESGKQKDKKD